MPDVAKSRPEYSQSSSIGMASCGKMAGADVTSRFGGAVIQAPDVVSNLGLIMAQHVVMMPFVFNSLEYGSKKAADLLLFT